MRARDTSYRKRVAHAERRVHCRSERTTAESMTGAANQWVVCDRGPSGRAPQWLTRIWSLHSCRLWVDQMEIEFLFLFYSPFKIDLENMRRAHRFSQLDSGGARSPGLVRAGSGRGGTTEVVCRRFAPQRQAREASRAIGSVYFVADRRSSPALHAGRGMYLGRGSSTSLGPTPSRAPPP